MNNIFVGNLSFKATKEDVIKLFEPFGSVANVVIMERKKGKSRGYGFVDMPNEEEKNAAIAALEGKEFMWRVLSVSPVVPKVKDELKPKKLKPVKKEWNPSEGRDSKPWVKNQGAPKSFDKNDRQSKSWNKESKDSKPWVKSQGATKPYRRDDRESKPWNKESKDFKPGVRSQRSAKPYQKDTRDDREPKKKYEGQSKPLVKREGSKVLNKPSKGFKMFYKVSGSSKTWPKKGQAR